MATRTIRIFLAYAEEDYKFRDLVVNQAKAARLPVEFADMPAKQPWVPRWKAACRARAFECDAAIVLVTKKTKQGVGVNWEVECICATTMPTLVVCMEKVEKSAVPSELHDFPVIDYNWPDVGSFIQSGGETSPGKDAAAR